MNGEPSAVGHGVTGVDDQIHQHLLELPGIGLDAGRARAGMGGELDVFADQPAQHLLGGAQQFVDGEPHGLQHLLAAEGEQLAGEHGGPGSGFFNGMGLAAHGRIHAELVLEKRGIAVDDHQQVVEVVRDAAGERAQGLHLMRLADALFELLFRGPVLHDDHHTGSPALIVVQQRDAVAEPDRGAILVRIVPLGDVAGDLSGDQAGELILPLAGGGQSAIR